MWLQSKLNSEITELYQSDRNVCILQGLNYSDVVWNAEIIQKIRLISSIYQDVVEQHVMFSPIPDVRLPVIEDGMIAATIAIDFAIAATWGAVPTVRSQSEHFPHYSTYFVRWQLPKYEDNT